MLHLSWVFDKVHASMSAFLWCTPIICKIINSCGLRIYIISTNLVLVPIEVRIKIRIYTLNMLLVIIKQRLWLYLHIFHAWGLQNNICYFYISKQISSIITTFCSFKIWNILGFFWPEMAAMWYRNCDTYGCPYIKNIIRFYLNPSLCNLFIDKIKCVLTKYGLKNIDSFNNKSIYADWQLFHPKHC